MPKAGNIISIENVEDSSALIPSAETPAPLNESLNAEEILIAYMEATKKFRTLDELRVWSKRSPSWFWKLRQKPEYQMQVRSALQAIANQVVQSAGGIAEAFNQEVLPSIATLREVRDNSFEKAGDRIKAATVLIDHAPEAPRAGSAVDDSRTLRISFPLQQMQNIEKALIDDEEGELVELLKDRDFKEIPSKEEMVPVRDMRDFDSLSGSDSESGE